MCKSTSACHKKSWCKALSDLVSCQHSLLPVSSAASRFQDLLQRRGQVLKDGKDSKQPVLTPCRVLDFELEMVSHSGFLRAEMS